MIHNDLNMYKSPKTPLTQFHKLMEDYEIYGKSSPEYFIKKLEKLLPEVKKYINYKEDK